MPTLTGRLGRRPRLATPAQADRVGIAPAIPQIGLLDEWGFDVVLRQLYPPDSNDDYIPARAPALALLMVIAGLGLVAVAGAGVLVYALRGSRARR